MFCTVTLSNRRLFLLCTAEKKKRKGSIVIQIVCVMKRVNVVIPLFLKGYHMGAFKNGGITALTFFMAETFWVMMFLFVCLLKYSMGQEGPGFKSTDWVPPVCVEIGCSPHPWPCVGSVPVFRLPLTDQHMQVRQFREIGDSKLSTCEWECEWLSAYMLAL